MQIYNITHSVDMDGMCSAALMMRNYGIPAENIFFWNYENDSIEHANRQIRKLKPTNSTFVISDIGAGDESLKKMLEFIVFLKKNHNRVVWLDHHHWSTAQIAKCSKLCDVFIGGENKNFCGAELVCNILCKKDRLNALLAKTAHKSDFPKIVRNPNPADLTKAFALKHFNSLKNKDKRDAYLRKVVVSISKGKLINADMRRAYAIYKKSEKIYLKQLFKSAVVIETKKNRIAIAFSKKLQATYACARLRFKYNAPITVYIETDRCYGHLRAPLNSSTDILPIAEAFGGGGHPTAGGFKLPFSKMTKAHKKWILNKVRNIVAKAY